MNPEDKKHKARQKRDLTKGPVMGHLIRLGIPMTIGIVAVMSAAVVDTWYISRLGTVPLAAISFCVPVLFAMQSLSIGLGIGASSVVSRAAGEGNRDQLARLVTDALLLAVLVVATVSIVGTLSVDPLFRLLRADPALMPDIRSYMHIAFIGAAFIVGPMVAGNLFARAGGCAPAGHDHGGWRGDQSHSRPVFDFWHWPVSADGTGRGGAGHGFIQCYRGNGDGLDHGVSGKTDLVAYSALGRAERILG
ncbi:MAG: MATE family efflux transporter [Robiginitomaculum sp.]|nr:MATE family efflux transporter [Robiginitomaculum sp.]